MNTEKSWKNSTIFLRKSKKNGSETPENGKRKPTMPAWLICFLLLSATMNFLSQNEHNILTLHKMQQLKFTFSGNGLLRENTKSSKNLLSSVNSRINTPWVGAKTDDCSYYSWLLNSVYFFVKKQNLLIKSTFKLIKISSKI